MLNILIPISGTSRFFDENEYKYPKPLIEIKGKPMIEWVISNLSSISSEKRFIFVVNKKDCIKHHLDDVLYLLTKGNCQIIKIDNDTKGAACSCLMAIEHIDSAEPLVISNGDQVVDADLNTILDHFRKADCAAGVVTFEAVHPKWSYVRLDETDCIIESSEKRPLSRHAIAGFYYFKKGQDFVKSAMNSIKKDANVDGIYYIAPTMNEMVLEGKRMITYPISVENYHNFYSPQRIKDYEAIIHK